MKRRGKMRPDTNTAPAMGERKGWRPLFLGVYSWAPWGGCHHWATLHIICRVSELPDLSSNRVCPTFGPG